MITPFTRQKVFAARIDVATHKSKLR